MNASSAVASRPSRTIVREWLIVLVLLALGAGLSFGAIKYARARGQQPRFYQENFAPAVMMTCGYGFTVPAAHIAPPSLTGFLLLTQETFDCRDFPVDLVPQPVTWNGTWYYLYGTVATIWRVTGISWTALDGLVAALAAVELLALYALFRLVVGRILSIAAALLVFVSFPNLAQLMFLRDFSKAPFVLGALWLLGWLILRPHSVRATMAYAAAYGAFVGIGYGFRSDLIVMVPFGAAIIGCCLPGPFRTAWRRNLAAAAVAVAAFVVAGWPPLQGQRTGGCQFHYALLGLTTPPLTHMNVESPLYAFGDHFLDTFVDLKVGDYADRVFASEPPILCSPDYDRVSGHLFFQMATTFPADLAVHAFGSVVTILSRGMPVSFESLLGYVPWAFTVAHPVDLLLGPLAAILAVGIAWAVAPRLGVALTIVILFLTGYPAIEFEDRHWFHLRFLPLWTVLLVGSAWVARARWRDRVSMVRPVVAVAVTLTLLVGSVWLLRVIQSYRVAALIEHYIAAPTEPVATTAAAAALAIDWQERIYSTPPGRRASEMLALTIAPEGCGGASPISLRFGYEAPLKSHDITSTMTVARAGSGPTRVFFPVYMQGTGPQTYLRFTTIDVVGADADCIREVARFSDRSRLPLWLQMQVPHDWSERAYQQRIRTPRFLRFLE